MTNNDYKAIEKAAAEFVSTLRTISDRLEIESYKATGFGMHQRGWALREEAEELTKFAKEFQELLVNAGY